MQTTVVVLTSVFFLSHWMPTDNAVDLAKALEQGLVSIEATGEGGHAGRSLRLNLTSGERKKLTLYVPAGFLFHSADTSEQDLIVIQSMPLVLEKNQRGTLRLHAMCTQASHASPRAGSLFSAGKVAEGKLGELARYIDQKDITSHAAQDAIWAVTDGHRLENIDDPDLAVFVANLLGKPIPTYVVQHASQSRPGARAYQPRPAVIKGVFAYQTDRDLSVSFGLYDEGGSLLKTLFADQLQRKGGHRFSFLFEVLNLPAGTYFARLTSEGKTIKELKVQF